MNIETAKQVVKSTACTAVLIVVDRADTQLPPFFVPGTKLNGRYAMANQPVSGSSHVANRSMHKSQCRLQQAPPGGSTARQTTFAVREVGHLLRGYRSYRMGRASTFDIMSAKTTTTMTMTAVTNFRPQQRKGHNPKARNSLGRSNPAQDRQD